MNKTAVLILGLVVGNYCLFSRAAIAEERKGWGDWQKIESPENLPFSSGFSNMELGGYLDYSYACEQAATAANVTPIFWYRLNDVVKTIGTGEVEHQCTINDEVVASTMSTAVLIDLPFPTCLTVQSDVGSGVNVRKDPDLTAPIIGFLHNGTQIMIEGSPAYLSTDQTGRTWLNMKFKQRDAWASLVDRDGGYINYQLCTTKAIANPKYLVSY